MPETETFFETAFFNAAFSGTTGTTIALLALSLLPFALLIMTSFAKTTMVFSLLRQAIGTQGVPSNMVILALAAILSSYIMTPVAIQMTDAASPIFEASSEELQDLEFISQTVESILLPWQEFLALNSGAQELELFASLREIELSENIEDTPLIIGIPAFAITELSEAFQIGFLLFLPFLILDLLVGSILLSLGMHMMSPTNVSLPFKLLLFVLVNGWIILSESLILGYTHSTGNG